MMLRIILSLVVAVAAPLLAACGASGTETEGISVVASTTHVGDIAANVGGERASVSVILEPNSDPHDYEPQPSDVEALIDADMILQSGGDVDLWLEQIVESSGTDAPVLSLLEQLATDPADPHWWQDPTLAVAAVEAIRDSLIEADPEGRVVYERNAESYVAELEALDADVRGCLGRVPAGDLQLVTSHDALGAYADRYGIEVIGAAIPALSTQAQASAGETAALVDVIRESGVAAIFPEAGVSQELEDAIAAEAGAEVGGELWADALGPEGSGGETYVESIQSNTRTLVEGLTAGAETCRFAAKV